MTFTKPNSEKELLNRAIKLSGWQLQDLANLCQVILPKQLNHAKGLVGQLLEKVLGATSGNLSQPDFNHLGIELKTLPINQHGLPQETTYICTVSIPFLEKSWHGSRAYNKLSRILWIPYQACPSIPIENRRLGYPYIWSPSQEIERILKQDWLELTEKIKLGQFETLSSHLGQLMQVRPKAANSKTLIQVINSCGENISIVPKGFYLRTKLTSYILKQHYAGNSHFVLR